LPFWERDYPEEKKKHSLNIEIKANISTIVQQDHALTQIEMEN